MVSSVSPMEDLMWSPCLATELGNSLEITIGVQCIYPFIVFGTSNNSASYYFLLALIPGWRTSWTLPFRHWLVTMSSWWTSTGKEFLKVATPASPLTHMPLGSQLAYLGGMAMPLFFFGIDTGESGNPSEEIGQKGDNAMVSSWVLLNTFRSTKP